MTVEAAKREILEIITQIQNDIETLKTKTCTLLVSLEREERKSIEFCKDCAHWQENRCLKGYLTRQDELTRACREAIRKE